MHLYFTMQVLALKLCLYFRSCSVGQSASKRLIFARDPLGRRSLLIHKPTRQQPYFLLTSVSVGPDPGYELDELSTENIYSLDLGRLSDMQDVRCLYHLVLCIGIIDICQLVSNGFRILHYHSD